DLDLALLLDRFGSLCDLLLPTVFISSTSAGSFIFSTPRWSARLGRWASVISWRNAVPRRSYSILLGFPSSPLSVFIQFQLVANVSGSGRIRLFRSAACFPATAAPCSAIFLLFFPELLSSQDDDLGLGGLL